jgi:hypothetical protein
MIACALSKTGHKGKIIFLFCESTPYNLFDRPGRPKAEIYLNKIHFIRVIMQFELALSLYDDPLVSIDNFTTT